MVSINVFRQIALSFAGTQEMPHFERRAFKIMNRKIFATLYESSGTANILLPLNDQAIYCSFDTVAVYSVPNKFGEQGWTTFELKKLPVALVSDALLTAYNAVLQMKPKKKGK